MEQQLPHPPPGAPDGGAGARPAALLGALLVVVAGAVAADRWAGGWAPHCAAFLMLLAPLVLSPDPRSLLLPDPRRALSGAAEGLAAAAVLIPAFYGALALFGQFAAVIALFGKFSPGGFSWSDLGAEAPVQVALFALPEEFFFRGFLQRHLDGLWPRRARVLGASCGPGLPVAAALFALAHLAVQLRPQALLVFFPGLAFGWLYARRGSIIGPVILHAACNLSLLACPGFLS